ncbi:MAG: UDP-glucose 4-epimerase GalE [Planktotalea sp.]|uniref:UDP-glucose 4-epimerase GalE n=1 Tax=Planktotalea sp. TaxID=2029877 RepID=UPI003C72078A
MRVFVTGGAGFIGSHTLVQLLRQNAEVTAFDNYSNSSPVALARVKRLAQSDLSSVEGDICNRAALETAMRAAKPDAVIHFAGLKAVGESSEKPLSYYKNNIAGSIALLETMDAVGCRNIVFSSSATVYDPAKAAPFTEEDPLGAVNPYGRTKQFIEEIIRDWAAANSDASAAILRYFNPVGAHVSGDIGEDPVGIPNNLMPFIARVAAGSLPRLQVFGGDYPTSDGTGARDYIHVEDLASAHLAALKYAATVKGCDVFNIGTGRSTTVLEMLHAFEQACGKAIAYRITERRAGDVASSVADVSKAKRILGWQAKYDVADMCQSSWNWQSRNPKGYDNGQ